MSVMLRVVTSRTRRLAGRTAITRDATVLHQMRRVAQTPRAFTNWAPLLSDMIRERVGRGPQSLHFRTRSGLSIVCPNRPGARVPVYEIFAEDCYRLAWFTADLAHRPLHVLDIGAHVGTFACSLAQLRPNALIDCFEPSATTAEYLRRNVAQNGFASRISVSERAVAATTGLALFRDNGAASGMNGLAGADIQSVSATHVETVALDDVVEALPASLDLVKIDCEGAECELVFGSSPGSWSAVQRVVLEYHPHVRHAWPQLRGWFEARGLAVVAHEPISAEQGTAWLSRTPL